MFKTFDLNFHETSIFICTQAHKYILLYILVHAYVLSHKWLKCCFTVASISLTDMNAQMN